MAFKKCNPGDIDAYGLIWIDGIQHEISDPESTVVMATSGKFVDKGSGRYSVDRTESAYIQVTFRRDPARSPTEYEKISCSTVQYQDRNYLYTINEAVFISEGYNPGDGEKISGRFMVAGGTEISSVRIS